MLNDRIRNLLLEYDYSKSTDPLQPFAAHVTSLLTSVHPQTSDIVVTAAEESFRLHKFILSARSPYFSKKLAFAPDASSWKLPSTLPPQSFGIAIRYLYLGEVPNDIGASPGIVFTEDEILEGLDKISKQLEVRSLWDDILGSGDRRFARQRRTDELEKGRDQIELWFSQNVLKHKIVTTTDKANDVQWDRDNSIFADIILRADEPVRAEENIKVDQDLPTRSTLSTLNGIPVGPMTNASRSPSRSRNPRKSVLFPAHRAMLLRSEYFSTMFSSSFREAQTLPHLHIIPIDCSPEVLEIVLSFLYTEKTEVPLSLALDVLYVADLLFIDKLKMRAAVIINTLGNGSISQIPSRLDPSDPTPKAENGKYQDELDIYEVIRAAWLLRVPRLEEFGARFIAFRLESFVDEPEFEDIVRESAARIQNRQETDTIELLDDIRHYLSERFRLRFEDAGIEELMDEEIEAAQAGGWEEKVPREQIATDEGVDVTTPPRIDLPIEAPETSPTNQGTQTGKIRTLDGEEVEDELEGEAMNYQILLGKIDRLLDKLKLDA